MPMSPPGIKVRINGAWVDVGGSAAPAGEEVVVGGGEPTDPVTELWYDEADPGAPADTSAPKGFLDLVTCPPTDQVGFGATAADVQNSIVTWTVEAGRVYRVSGQFVGWGDVSPASVNLYLLGLSGTPQHLRVIGSMPYVNAYVTIPFSAILSGLPAGDYSTKVAVSFTSGVGTIQGGGYVMVEDIGGV